MVSCHSAKDRLTDLGTKRREPAIHFRLNVMMKFRLDLERYGVDFEHWKFNHFLQLHDKITHQRKISIHSN